MSDEPDAEVNAKVAVALDAVMRRAVNAHSVGTVESTRGDAWTDTVTSDLVLTVDMEAASAKVRADWLGALNALESESMVGLDLRLDLRRPETDPA